MIRKATLPYRHSSLMQSKPIIKNKPGTTFTIGDFVKIYQLKKRIKATHQQTQSLQNEINEKLADQQKYLSILQRRSLAKLRVEKLKEELENQQKILKKEGEQVKQTKQSLLPKVRIISKSEIALLASKEMLTEEKQNLELNSFSMEDYFNRRVTLKWKLVGQLRSIFPIGQAPEGKSLTINGFALPNSDFAGCDEEQIAVALGFVTHVVFMLSKYLEIPLRYPVLPMCSRSVIRDNISQQISPKFPLYSRGVDKTRFEYGVFLLNKNLEQLLNSLGMDIISLRHTLPNLQVVLNHSPKHNTIKKS